MSRMTFAEGLRALQSAQKPNRGTAAYSRRINRPAGRIVSAAVNTFSMTPNQATAISATMSATAIALIALVEPTIISGIAIAALLAGGYVMDSVDGQLARLRGQGSKAGEWLDHTVDSFKTASLHLAVLISWFRWPAHDDDRWLLVPLGFTIVAVVTFFGLMLMPTLRPKSAAAPTPESPENPLRHFALLPTDSGFQCWLFVLLGWPLVFSWVYTAVFACCVLALAAAMRKWWRELRALDAQAH